MYSLHLFLHVDLSFKLSYVLANFSWAGYFTSRNEGFIQNKQSMGNVHQA